MFGYHPHFSSWNITQRVTSAFVISVVALWELLYVAWISDDAAITHRVVMNFTYGHGPVFNVGERVQAFTHPLWFLLLSLGQYIFPHIVTVNLTLSIGLSLLFMVLVTQLACRRFMHSLLMAAIVMTCKSYVDFSSSGLENPLSNLLLALFIFAAVRALRVETTFSMVTVGLVGSLVYLTRTDLTLLILPLSVYVAVRLRPRRSQAIQASCAALIPVLAWTSFSIIYYGFPFPNTAYAKIGTGASLLETLLQGWSYFKQSFSVDPITLTTIVVGVLIGLLFGGPERWLSVGAILYLSYLLFIGGDFMSGRFFGAPFIAALIILARKPRHFAIIGTGLVLCGAFNFNSAVMDQTLATGWDASGIADERRYYLRKGSLKAMLSSGKLPDYRGPWESYAPRSPIPVSITCGGLGYMGLEAGPQVHMVDTCGLSDPLLSRMPSRPYQRIGHAVRNIPAKYELSVQENRNYLVDEDIHNLYDDIRLVTRGPLFTRERWKAIYKLNLGRKWDLSRWATYSPESVDTGVESTPKR